MRWIMAVPWLVVGCTGSSKPEPSTTEPVTEADADTDSDTDSDADSDSDSDTDADADADTDTDTDTDADTDTATLPTSDTSPDTGTTPSTTVDEAASTVELFGPVPHEGLEIVLHHRDGAAPSPEALDILRGALADLEASGHIVKPGGVTVSLGVTLPASTDPSALHTFDELDDTLEATRGPFVNGDNAVIHGLYTDGTYDTGGAGTLLGYAYGGAKMVMMRDAIDNGCSGPLDFPLLPILSSDACATFEAAVLLHELGHLFGLVDNGLTMVVNHEDPNHAAHDEDPDCLMYFAADTPDFADSLAIRFLTGNTELPGYDDHCLDDMEAALP